MRKMIIIQEPWTVENELLTPTMKVKRKKVEKLFSDKYIDWYEDEKAASLREVSASGNFVRTESQFRNWITKDGSAGPTGEAGYIAEPDRYHLYVAHTCPWAHRALIFLNLKKIHWIF